MSLKAKPVLDALKQLRESSTKRNFSQSVELIINLQDIDMKKPESRIQESIELSNPPGEKTKICVIATGELALKAKKAGAELVIGQTELEALATDKKGQKQLAGNYDAFLAEASLMPLVGRVLGSILGPRGKMPKPVPPNVDIKAQLERWRKTVTVRLRGQPILQCKVGSEAMKDEEITENILAIISRIESKLKRGFKNISAIYLKTTMGKPVKITV